MKKLVIALMAFALVITLAGCGGGGGGGGFHLDRGDNGAGLEKNGFTDVRAAYTTMNENITKYDSTSDKDGSKRSGFVASYISESYKGSSSYSADVSTKAKLVARLKYLISAKVFEGLEIIPMQTLNGAVKDQSVSEKTKLYVSSLVQDNKKYTNKEYNFENVKWVKEGSSWKIVSGLDDLGKSRKDMGF